MTQPGSFGNIIPGDRDGTARAIADIKRKLKELEGAETGNAMTIDGLPGLTVKGGGYVSIIEGGGLAVVDPTTGTTIFLASAGYPFNDGSGRTQGAAVFRRADDGSVALVLADLGSVPGHPFSQPLQWFDRNGHIVLADDANGNGLARPHLTVGPMLPTDITKWPGGFATVFTTIAECYFERQNPQLAWLFQLYSPAATTTQFRLLLGGVQIGSTQTVTNAFASWNETQPIPSAITFGSTPLLELQVKATSGTGSCAAQQLFLETVQA